MNARERALGQMEFTRSMVVKFVDGLPADRACEGDNHALWTLGHLASTDAWAAGILGVDASVPPAWEKLFGYGSKCVDDPKAYPPLAEVRTAFDEIHAKLVAFFTKATDAALDAPLKEKSGGFFKDGWDTMFKLAWHEGWHTGQLAAARRSMQLPSVFAS